MTKTEVKLERTLRHLKISRWVLIACVAIPLLMINSGMFSPSMLHVAFWILFPTGFCVLVFGIQCSFASMNLERQALRESDMLTPLERSMRPKRDSDGA